MRARSAAEIPVVVPLPGLDGNAEGGAEAGAVLTILHHEGDAELVQPLRRHGQTNETPSVGRHEVDDLGGHLLRGDGEIALVLAVLVVRRRPPCVRHGCRRGLLDMVANGISLEGLPALGR